MPLRWQSSWWSWLLTAVLIAPMIVVAFGTNAYLNLARNDRDRVACIQRWADTYTARAERITKVNGDLNAAQGAYIHALNQALQDAIRGDQAAVQRDLPAYQAAAENYERTAATQKRAVERDPIPAPPKFTCH